MNPEPRLVYVAEPIDQAKGPAPIASAMVTALSTMGYGIFRPAIGFRARELDPRIDRINRDILYQADVLVAYLPAGASTIGVPAEIEAATARGIPAVVYHDGTSMVLAANPLVTVINDSPQVVQAVEKAIANHPRNQSPDPIKLVLAEGHDAPRRAYPDDAGIDLTCTENLVLNPNEFKDVRTQVMAVELPPGLWGMITGRSSTLRKWELHVPVAVIDPGYRGPLYVGVWNLSRSTVTVPAKSRLAQLICMVNLPRPIMAVDSVEEHARGLSGFGSSGE